MNSIKHIDNLIKKSKIEEAKKFISKSIKNSPNTIELIEKKIEIDVISNPKSDNLNDYIKIIDLSLEQQNYSKTLSVVDYLERTNKNYNLKNFHKGQIYLNLNNIEKSINYFNKSLNKENCDHYVLYFLGLIEVKNKNNFNQAIKYLNQSIKIKETPEAWNEIGFIHALETPDKRSNLFSAAKSFQRSIELDSDYLYAHENLGLIYEKQGNYRQALLSYLEPFKEDNNYYFKFNEKKYIQLGMLIAKLFNTMALKKIGFNDDHRDIFAIILNYNFIEPNTVKFVSETFVDREIKKIVLEGFHSNKYTYETIQNPTQNIKDLTNDKIKYLYEDIEDNDLNSVHFINFITSPIVNLHLKKILNSNIYIENYFSSIRMLLLKKILYDNESNSIIDDNFLYFAINLANQSFHNEYVWFISSEELSNLSKLEKKIIKRQKIKPVEMAILASYKMLYDYKDLRDFLLDKSIQINEDIQEIIKKQISDPIAEKNIIPSIEKITKIKEDISLRVQKQYESNPYPRWYYKGAVKRKSYIDRIRLELISKYSRQTKISYPNQVEKVLIAGCGTGKHPIDVAQMCKDAEVYAIDLSLPSIAYGKNRAEEMGIKNINWLHGDINNLNNFSFKFDAIESVGVLHHMKDPQKGFNVLSSMLKENGFFKIGLYARSFREKLKPAKNFIKKEIENKNIESIRRVRKALIENNDENISFPKTIGDFYSTSPFIDLLMHEQELDFDISELKKIYEKKYKFLGFCINPKYYDMAKSEYKRTFPKSDINEIDNWTVLERKDYKIFASMYQFWLQKNINY